MLRTQTSVILSPAVQDSRSIIVLDSTGVETSTFTVFGRRYHIHIFLRAATLLCMMLVHLLEPLLHGMYASWSICCEGPCVELPSFHDGLWLAGSISSALLVQTSSFRAVYASP